MQQLKEITYLHGFSEQDDYEMNAKGYRDDIQVELSDGTKHRLCFYDAYRLQQDIEEEKIIYSHGLVVVDNLTKETVIDAVLKMIASNYFENNL